VIPFVLNAEIVVQIHAPFDDLATAIAFYAEDIISFFRFCGCAAEETFEETHKYLSVIPTSVVE
jgi:hypothetical protein